MSQYFPVYVKPDRGISQSGFNIDHIIVSDAGRQLSFAYFIKPFYTSSMMTSMAPSPLRGPTLIILV